MRYFNTYGPVNEAEHYVVHRAALEADLLAQIDQGIYFTIFAPRQMGKTTLLRRLADALAKQPVYLPITLNFEVFADAPVSNFLQALSQDIGWALRDALARTAASQLAALEQLLNARLPEDFLVLRDFFFSIGRLLPERRIVLIVDEFDGVLPGAIAGLLQTWRQIYLQQQRPHTLHSVILVGIQNIAALNLGRSSPFNIARQVRLPNFDARDVRALLEQYTSETGQPFAPGVIEEIHRQTGGQPFLVNRVAAIVTEEVATNRLQPITKDHLHVALCRLGRESNYNFETLQRHAAEHQEHVIKMLFGARYPFTRNNPLVKTLEMYGIIHETPEGDCQIANPIYERVLIDYFTPFEIGLHADMLVNGHDFRPYVVDQRLQMDKILSHFREFVERRGREAFKVTNMPQEATGQYLLSAYLDIVVRQVGGEVFTEVPSGPGRLDLIVVHQGTRYVIETKIWRGQAGFDKGVAQLVTYLQTEGQDMGYLVVFHARPSVYGQLTYHQLEFPLDQDGVLIYVYLVRIGPFVE